jgi:hypothetical protein
MAPNSGVAVRMMKAQLSGTRHMGKPMVLGGSLCQIGAIWCNSSRVIGTLAPIAGLKPRFDHQLEGIDVRGIGALNSRGPPSMHVSLLQQLSGRSPVMATP